ncbi:MULTISPECIES: TonB-dependent receptor domain-containing protein [unclassified Variovorax]|uniref:TonB-dependent receptor domain-containing protein n=1 Tax=unclassified Variovorax TaxID=663243 RepID=UPI0008AFF316|nr:MULTISPECIES: TonB-dependent receptor [unclassified Variovorax]SEK03715.1 vitamin B12 transporter [Variovorax sp. OK202]SFD37275.1 vitamin B12 transporter [Variovorax sp. OK212]
MISHVCFSRGSAPARRLRVACLPLALVSAFGAFGGVAHAQETPALVETVVTANRTPQPLSELVGDVSIVDRQAIERSGATGVADVLSRLPGIEISRTGGVGNTTSLFIRGAETRFTAVYLDGVRIDSQSTGGAGWEGIPLSQIDRIEVLRGPAAAVYGSDAVGGVIQLFTRRGEEGVRPYAGIGFGSNGLRKIEGGVSGKSGLFDYSFGVAHEESKGYNLQPVEKRNVVKDGFTNPDRDGYHSTSGNVKLGLQITPDQRIEATLLTSDTTAAYDPSVAYKTKLPILFREDESNNTLRTAGLTWSARWNDIYSTRVQVTDSQSVYKTQPSFYRTETNLRGYLFQNEFRFGPHLVSATFERREDALENAPTTSAKLLSRDRSQDAISLGYGFVQGPHSLQLHVRHDKDSEFGGKTTGSAAYGYAITPALRFTASAGTAFRVPTLYQRFSEYGLPTLKPESSRNAELGLQYTDGGTQAGIVVYKNRVRNLIVFDGSATGCASSFGCYSSTARARYQGATLSGSQRLGDVTLRGSVDFQDPRDEATHNLLARRAQRHATLGADWRVAGWTLGAEVQTSGRRYDDAANAVRLGGYTLLNLSASTRITRDLNLVARVDNVGNKDYQFARLYANAGRTAYVGLKWTPQ